jgi:hypothetical protein
MWKKFIPCCNESFGADTFHVMQSIDFWLSKNGSHLHGNVG